MKILLTGRPKSGKTTILAKLLEGVTDKRGLVAKEVRKSSERIGFDLVDNSGKTASLSRVGQPTSYQVGRYFVDVDSLDGFVEPLLSFTSKQLLYIDEIGQMQLYSERFRKLVVAYLDASNHFIGTITSVHKDEFVEDIKSRRDILTCEITPDNRAELEKGLVFAVEHRDMIADLPPAVQRAIVELGTAYLNADNYTYFKKLFKNAVPYIAQGRIRREEDGFVVEGNTNDHHVIVNENQTMSCDCDLFNGQGKFEGKEGECSHIQTATLLQLAEDK